MIDDQKIITIKINITIDNKINIKTEAIIDIMIREINQVNLIKDLIIIDLMIKKTIITRNIIKVINIIEEIRVNKINIILKSNKEVEKVILLIRIVEIKVILLKMMKKVHLS